MQAHIGELIIGVLLCGLTIWLKSLVSTIKDLEDDHRLMSERLARLESGRGESLRRLEVIEAKIDALVISNEHALTLLRASHGAGNT